MPECSAAQLLIFKALGAAAPRAAPGRGKLPSACRLVAVSSWSFAAAAALLVRFPLCAWAAAGGRRFSPLIEPPGLNALP